MMTSINMHFFDYKLQDWQNASLIKQLDQDFLDFLKQQDKQLHQRLNQYRRGDYDNNGLMISEIIIDGAQMLDDYLTQFFQIPDAVEQLSKQTLAHRPIFGFKKWFVLRRAKRRLMRDEDLADFDTLNAWLQQQLPDYDDEELAIAQYGLSLLDDKKTHADAIEHLSQWCIQALKTPQGKAYTQGWSSFKLSKKRQYNKLIPLEVETINETETYQQLPADQWRKRDGFELTDERMAQREVMSEIDYCIYCHKNEGDFCSKGFPEKKSDPDSDFRTNPLGNQLDGCPLEEKISEMHSLKRDGYSLGALATVMIDNPMCPATGHRICNDCMKACIYQKQDPVDIPQIESRVLTDILDLPWGVEIYDLLTRWNPLRREQATNEPYNGLKMFIAGMGPAGFTLAHHLLMEGCAVVGTDGLKIEPLPDHLVNQPIQHFDQIKENLADRLVTGFGGVAEYGITVRWDKNFLKLIYINLLRRPHFQLFGGVRLGGTVTIEDLWQLGFDHAAISVGAGLPKALPVENSLAKGMRQANDFLMALQLTGAAHDKNLANLQVRMPIVVIGGGLTGVDTATEAQAYYIKQAEKTWSRYYTLCQYYGEQAIRNQFDAETLTIIDELLQHAHAIRQERQQAADDNRTPDFMPLLHQWGGVTIVYRRSVEESPAYISNHEELAKAFEEGIFYREGLQPVGAELDEFGAVKALRCHQRVRNEEGNWLDSDETTTIYARSVLVATGARPNVAYNFEHQGTFEKESGQYRRFEIVDDELTVAPKPRSVKSPDFGPFTSYCSEDNHHVSFVGDTHPLFHGSVVKAIASGMRTYPKIMDLFGERARQTVDTMDYEYFAQTMHDQFNTYIYDINRRSSDIIELTIKAPMAAKNYKPGQFFRVQNLTTSAPESELAQLQMEPLALSGFNVDRDNGLITSMVMEKGASSRLCATLQPGDPIACMGPTGVRSKIPRDYQNIMVIGNQLGLAYIRAVGPSLKAEGNRVVFVGYFDEANELYCRDEIEACADQVYWLVRDKQSPIAAKREQDYSLNGDLADLFNTYQHNSSPIIPISDIDRITIIGGANTLKEFQHLRQHSLQSVLKQDIKVFGSIYSTMQCMLKGVCAQCLQWQIDPETGQRTKAVFACSWQDQPLELVDLTNMDERLAQNAAVERLTNLWLDYVFEQENIPIT